MLQLPRVGWRLLACKNGASPDCIIVVVEWLSIPKEQLLLEELTLTNLFFDTAAGLRRGVVVLVVVLVVGCWLLVVGCVLLVVCCLLWLLVLVLVLVLVFGFLF